MQMRSSFTRTAEIFGLYQDLLEGMSFWCLLNGLQDILVDCEDNGAQENGQRKVGEDTDNREADHGQKNSQSGSEDSTRLLRVTPVNQGFHWKKQGKDGLKHMRNSLRTEFKNHF